MIFLFKQVFFRFHVRFRGRNAASQRECHHYRNQGAICWRCDNLHHLETIGLISMGLRLKSEQQVNSSLELSNETKYLWLVGICSEVFQFDPWSMIAV